MLAYLGKKMDKKIWQALTVIVLLSNLSLVNNAHAGFFTQLMSKETSGDLLVDFQSGSVNSFEKLYAWNSSSDLTKNIEEKELKWELQVVKTYTVRATAYSSTPDQTDDTPFVTASGTYVRDGILAANFLPFGTKVRIPEIYGDKVFVVEDRMNKRYWHNVDIWFPERSLAKAFGSKRVVIEVVEES